MGFDLVPRSPLKIVHIPAKANSGRSSFKRKPNHVFLLRGRVWLRRIFGERRLSIDGHCAGSVLVALVAADSGLRAALDRHHLLGIEPMVDPIGPMLHQLRARADQR